MEQPHIPKYYFLETNRSSLTSPYTNISNPQTIFVRVSNPATQCYDFTTLTLEVLPIPEHVTLLGLCYCNCFFSMSNNN